MPPRYKSSLRMLRPGLVLLVALCGFSVFAQTEQHPISEAEQRLFLDNHLKDLPNPSLLQYRFSKTGSLEQTFDDKASVEVKNVEGSKGKACKVSFLSGEREFKLPEVESATGNPVILAFLERDVREMQRLTKGQPNYFRRRLRIALAEIAEVKPVTFQFAGREVKGTRIQFRPFDKDPVRSRFERYANKTYFFTLSGEVPGAVYEMRSVMSEGEDTKPGETKPLIEEALIFTGTEK